MGFKGTKKEKGFSNTYLSHCAVCYRAILKHQSYVWLTSNHRVHLLGFVHEICYDVLRENGRNGHRSKDSIPNSLLSKK